MSQLICDRDVTGRDVTSPTAGVTYGCDSLDFKNFTKFNKGPPLLNLKKIRKFSKFFFHRIFKVLDKYWSDNSIRVHIFENFYQKNQKCTPKNGRKPAKIGCDIQMSPKIKTSCQRCHIQDVTPKRCDICTDNPECPFRMDSISGIELII